MVHIASFCIDRYEAHLLDHSPFEVPTTGIAHAAIDAIPQAYISGVVAASACEAANKRLCTSEEWLQACRGEANRIWPYGDTYQESACNDHRDTHPITDFWGDDPDRWSSSAMNDPGINQQPNTVAPSGTYADCATPEGVFDLHGNLHEWVADAEGIFRGGFYADASLNGEGCAYRTTAHAFGYHDYSTGFRCCADSQ